MRFKVRVIRKRTFCSPASARFYAKFNRNNNKFKKRHLGYITKVEKTKTYLSISEMKLRNVCRNIFKTRKIMYNNRNILRGLELDIYIPELKIGIEFNGEQHYSFTKEFHKDFQDFENQQKRDMLKKELCKRYGIRLLILKIPNENKMRKEIIKFLSSEDIGSNRVGLPMRQEDGKGLSLERIPEPLAQV